MTKDSRQAYRIFDDSPQRFRDSHDETKFDGASDVLFEQAMAQTRMAICLSDPNRDDSPIVFANRAFIDLTGYPESEIVGRNCRFLQGPDTDPEAVRRIRKALETGSVTVVELLNYRKDGSRFWNALHLGPIYNDRNELLYYFGSQWDVSDVHAARAEEAHSKAMARELSHRMKNMFAVITSIVRTTGRIEGNPEIARTINGRIRALGRAYEQTLDDASRGSIEVGQAIRAVLSPYDPGGTRFRFIGNGLRADTNVVSVLGLTLHELATNAVEDGALSVEGATIDVDWRDGEDADGVRRLVVLWSERVDQAVASERSASKTGKGIIEALLQSADGTIADDWSADGFEVRLTLPYGTGRSS